MNYRSMKKILAAVLAGVMMLGAGTACGAAANGNETASNGTEEYVYSRLSMEDVPVPEGFEPFIRIDIDDPDAWKGDLKKLRLVTEGRYEFIVPDEKYGVPDMEPGTAGLDTLDISGSAEFSEQQFHELAETLRDCAGGKEIYIVDLRRESHAMLNGVSCEWYASYNWSNYGMTAEEIEKDQDERFGSLVGKSITVYPKEDNMPSEEGVEIQVETYLTERELVEGEGFHYVRIPVLDHAFPSPEEVDAFVEFVKGIDMDNSWLHFHCQGGKGRTIIFMMMYDKMKNPDVPMLEIMVRQTKLGGIYPLYISKEDAFKQAIYEERAEQSKLFFEYVDENREDGYKQKWSDWLAEQSR